MAQDRLEAHTCPKSSWVTASQWLVPRYPAATPPSTPTQDEPALTQAAPSVLHPARAWWLGGFQRSWTHLGTEGAGLGLDLEQWVSRNPQRLA